MQHVQVQRKLTAPFGVNLMRSQVLYQAAQILIDVEVAAWYVVPLVSSSDNISMS